MKNRIRVWIPAVLLIVLYLWIQHNTDVLRKYDFKVNLIIRNTSMGLDGQAAAQMQKESQKGKGLLFAVWKQGDAEVINGPDTGRFHKTSVITVCGRTDLLLQSKQTLDFDDLNQCLIGADTAYALFGGSDVKGLKVLYQQKEYKVAGILKDVKDAFVYQTNNAEVEGLNRITILKGSKDSASVTREKFQNLYGIDAALVDYELTSFILQCVVFLLPGILAVLFMGHYKRQFLKSSSGIKYVVIYGLFVALFIFAAIFSAKGFIHIPEEVIPTVWSDAEFWTRLYAEKKQNLALMLSMKKEISDTFYVNAFLKAIVGFVLSIVCIMHIDWHSGGKQSK